jgi:glutathione S-transferase
MRIYFSPLACSLATRIALYEAGVSAEFVQVDMHAQRTEHGDDYRAIHRLGLVPLLECEDGYVSENAAILQYLGERYADAALLPKDPLGRTRARQWLSFVGSELHKTVFYPLLDRSASDEVKRYALEKAPVRLDYVAERLANRPYLLDDFGVADAYLFAVLNWTAVTPVELRRWPALARYHNELRTRPSVARAFEEERKLYAREQGQSRPT